MAMKDDFQPTNYGYDPFLQLASLNFAASKIIISILIASSLVFVAFDISLNYLNFDFLNQMANKFGYARRDSHNFLRYIAIVIALGMSLDLINQLIKILDSVKQGNPFIMENSLSLSRIGYILIGMKILNFIEKEFLKFSSIKSDAELSYLDWLPSSIITIIVVFILARVFKEGVRLNDEARLTV
jgi:Protein of unknown function (DUF2975)